MQLVWRRTESDVAADFSEDTVARCAQHFCFCCQSSFWEIPSARGCRWTQRDAIRKCSVTSHQPMHPDMHSNSAVCQRAYIERTTRNTTPARESPSGPAGESYRCIRLRKTSACRNKHRTGRGDVLAANQSRFDNRQLEAASDVLFFRPLHHSSSPLHPPQPRPRCRGSRGLAVSARASLRAGHWPPSAMHRSPARSR